MKTYKGQELIKAAKYLQKMGSVRSKIEQDFTLDSIDVEDREATVHYLGKVEGEDAKLNVTVFKAKTYGNVYAAYLAGQRFEEKDYDRVYIWLHTITKLDTEEAKTGKLQLLPEQWNKVHKDFMKKFFKDFVIGSLDIVITRTAAIFNDFANAVLSHRKHSLECSIQFFCVIVDIVAKSEFRGVVGNADIYVKLIIV